MTEAVNIGTQKGQPSVEVLSFGACFGQVCG